MNSVIPTDLMKFAYIPQAWFGMLDYLENLAIKENWNFRVVDVNRKNRKNPILENYIFHTFRRLAFERNSIKDENLRNLKIYIDDEKACFNTGLFTKNYKYIYAFLVKNQKEDTNLKWVLKGFYDDSSPNLSDISTLPVRAEYFSDISDLIYNTKLELRVNTSHILDNPNNKQRIPENVRDLPNLPMLFDGAIQLAKKKIECNYKVAVPQYYQDKIQFLIPISLVDMEKVDLALAVSKQNGYYTGSTCLTMDMAYNNARLIARPDSEWLNP